MPARIPHEPSPLKTTLVHSTMAALCLTGLLGVGGMTVQLTGNPDAASPSVRVALFEEAPETAPQLNPRLPGDSDPTGFVMAEYDSYDDYGSGDDEADLGVEYADQAAQDTRFETASLNLAAAIPEGVRINGQTVLPGQSLSQVQSGLGKVVQVAQQPSPVVSLAGVESIEGSPFAAHARAFENPDGKPTISIIVGGLGINAGRTQAAISELPPEVTLAFAPTTTNLSGWIRKARRAGHEVLIELPMEPYDYGRLAPHPQVMQVGVGSEVNLERLEKILSRSSGYFGVLNYQGGKFATDFEAASPVLKALQDKGIAFFEDGSLARSVFSDVAKTRNMAFGKADSWIDGRPEGDEIANQFLILEVQAREEGSALGTAMSFPITIDMLKEWLPTLESKGLVLAPASYHAGRNLNSGQIQTAALDQRG